MHFIRIDNPSYFRYVSNYIDLSQYNLDVEYFNKINSLLSLEFNCQIYKWNKEVFNNPSFKCDLQTPITLRKKINIIPSILYYSKKRFVASSINQNGNSICISNRSRDRPLSICKFTFGV